MLIAFLLLASYTEPPQTQCRDVCEVLDMLYVEAEPVCVCFDPVTKRLERFEVLTEEKARDGAENQ